MHWQYKTSAALEVQHSKRLHLRWSLFCRNEHGSSEAKFLPRQGRKPFRFLEAQRGEGTLEAAWRADALSGVGAGVNCERPLCIRWLVRLASGPVYGSPRSHQPSHNAHEKHGKKQVQSGSHLRCAAPRGGGGGGTGAVHSLGFRGIFVYRAGSLCNLRIVSL